MLALLLAVALIGLIVLALLLAGALIAAVTGLLALNACVLVLRLHRRRSRDARPEPMRAEPWQPSSFRRAPELAGEPASEQAGESVESRPTLRAYRL